MSSNPIKPPMPRDTTDWLEFPDPDDMHKSWRIDLNFIMSPWQCFFGEGCPGHFGIQDANTNPDIGCCSLGTPLKTVEERDRVQSFVDQLTEDELSPAALKQVQSESGWYIDYRRGRENPEDPDSVSIKTRVRNGGCIFANRAGEQKDGKIGCAFHHLGQRLGLSHTEVMPDTCWMVPISKDEEAGIGEDEVVVVISAIRGKDWGGLDEDGDQDSWMSWWCIDTPDAYMNEGKRLYRTMEEELRKVMGDRAYAVMLEEIHKREGNYVPPTSGMVRNEGRPMLPLLVGNRTPKRMKK